MMCVTVCSGGSELSGSLNRECGRTKLRAAQSAESVDGNVTIDVTAQHQIYSGRRHLVTLYLSIRVFCRFQRRLSVFTLTPT